MTPHHLKNHNSQVFDSKKKKIIMKICRGGMDLNLCNFHGSK